MVLKYKSCCEGLEVSDPASEERGTFQGPHSPPPSLGLSMQEVQAEPPGAMASPSGSPEDSGKLRGRDGRQRREEEDAPPEEKRLKLGLEGGSSAQEEGEDAPRLGREETGTQTGATWLWSLLAEDCGPPGHQNQVNFSLSCQEKDNPYGRFIGTHHGKSERDVSQCGLYDP
ncbi:hypothetical protein PANDA_014006 [Ailuropoda melanoleuca]|uniref:Uncharacterized protein n=1 Tax=Ailuropoda melanoleuca TaxID=9646 RepID=D2HQ63_AILME|nr:hypothetical protein PANDA_014006 [Ailuropoda melanoleuca]